MGMLGYKITTLTGIIPPLMIVIGIPNAVYMITKYQQVFLKAGNRIRALSRMIERTGKSMFLINVTTAVGFATLIITPGRMLMEFGMVATINCMLLFLLSLVLNPILFSYLPDPNQRHTRHLTNKRSGKFIDILVKIVERHRPKVYIVSVLLLAVSIYGMLLIRASGKVADDVPKHSQTYSDLTFFENNFNGVMPFEIMIDTKKEKKATLSPKLWKKVNELQDSIASIHLFSRPVSFIELVKYCNQSYYRGSEKEYRIPNQLDLPNIQSFIRNSREGGNDSLLVSYMDTTGRYIRIRAQMKDMGTHEMDKTIQRITEQAHSIFKDEDVDITISGASVVILKGTEYLMRNLITSISVAILIIALMMAPMFRKMKMIIISLIPNILPLLFTAGVMGLFGIPLKASTIIIYGIAFGITVDSTIHFLAKYLQELKYYKGNVTDATYSAIRDTALSMAYTSMILFFGFSVFIASDFGGTKALGILISFTLLMGFFCNLTLLPCLLLSLQGKRFDKDYDKYSVIDDDDDDDTERAAEKEQKTE
jgi:predicted RND superfamily exporter protein